MSQSEDLQWLETPSEGRRTIANTLGRLRKGVYPLSSTESPAFIPNDHWEKGVRVALALRGNPMSLRTNCGIAFERHDEGKVDQDSIGVVKYLTAAYAGCSASAWQMGGKREGAPAVDT